MKLKEKAPLIVLLGVLVAFLFLYIEDITSDLATGAIGLVLLLGIITLGFRRVKHEKDTNYPYRPGIEIRPPNGRITTRGYAGRHPREFTYWYDGPDDVRGENIDPEDWQEWRTRFDERYRLKWKPSGQKEGRKG